MYINDVLMLILFSLLIGQSENFSHFVSKFYIIYIHNLNVWMIQEKTSLDKISDYGVHDHFDHLLLTL